MCLECGKGFQDMRGLTSHARHIHDLGKNEIIESDKENNSENWKVFGSVGALILAFITLSRMK